MPIEILINGVGGEKSYFKIDVNHNDFTKYLSVDFEVSSIEFDPNRWLISKDNTVVLNPDLANTEYNFEEWTTIVKDYSIQINTTNYKSKSLNIKLYDATGKVVVSNQLNGTSNFNFKTGLIPKGVYYLVFDDGYRIVSKTILK